MLYLVLLASLPVLLEAHVHDFDQNLLTTVYKPPDYEGYCEGAPTIYSYHIHVMFWQNNKPRTASALELREQFIKRFELEGKDCEIFPGDPAPGHEMCVFEVNLEPAGPFTTAQYAFYIPPGDLLETSAWMLQHRGVQDVFIHPNTGCETNDHTKWYTFSGDKWPIDASIFSCDRPGCKPKS